MFTYFNHAFKLLMIYKWFTSTYDLLMIYLIYLYLLMITYINYDLFRIYLRLTYNLLLFTYITHISLLIFFWFSYDFLTTSEKWGPGVDLYAEYAEHGMCLFCIWKKGLHIVLYPAHLFTIILHILHIDQHIHPVPEPRWKCCIKCKMKGSHLKLTQRML